MVLTKGMSRKPFKNKKINCMFPIFHKWVSFIFFLNKYICIIYKYIYIYIYYIIYIIYIYIFIINIIFIIFYICYIFIYYILYIYYIYLYLCLLFLFFYLVKPGNFIIAIIITIIFINVTVKSVLEKSSWGEFQESNSSRMVYPYSSR